MLGDGRLMLPAAVRHQLNDNRIQQLWISRVPDAKALVLCPPHQWNQWTAQQQKKYPYLSTTQASRTFWSHVDCKEWDKKGRLYLSTDIRQHAQLEPDQIAIIIGRNQFYEVWSATIYNVLEKKETALLPSSFSTANNNHDQNDGPKPPKFPLKTPKNGLDNP